MICAANENASAFGSCFNSLNGDLVFVVDAQNQLILQPATKGASALVNAAIAGALKGNLLP